MGKKYRIDTDKGSFIIETDEPDSPSLPDNYQSPVYGPTGASGKEMMQDQAANVLRGIPQAITGIPGAIKSGVSGLAQVLTGGGTGELQEMGAGMAQPFMTAARGAKALMGDSMTPNPSEEEWAQAAQGSGAMLGGAAMPNALSGLAKALAYPAGKILPSAVRSGANLDLIKAAGQNAIPDLSQTGKVLARARELKDTGHGPMTAGMKGLEKASAPGSPPIYYPQSFDFASAAKNLVSKNRPQTGMMKAQVKLFAKAMQEANRDVAAKMGMGDLFDSAMKEYRQAKTIEAAGKIVTKYAKLAALGAALGGAGKMGYDVMEKVMP